MSNHPSGQIIIFHQPASLVHSCFSFQSHEKYSRIFAGRLQSGDNWMYPDPNVALLEIPM